MENTENKSSSLNAKQYRFVCELLWGGAPIDRNWAEGTKLFTSQATKILEQYPMLDKSFFESYVH